MPSNEKTVYSGTEKIEELKPHFIADILSGESETRQKVNEIIKKVNLILDIINGKIR